MYREYIVVKRPYVECLNGGVAVLSAVSHIVILEQGILQSYS